jgi:hypothetical protein
LRQRKQKRKSSSKEHQNRTKQQQQRKILNLTGEYLPDKLAKHDGILEDIGYNTLMGRKEEEKNFKVSSPNGIIVSAIDVKAFE